MKKAIILIILILALLLAAASIRTGATNAKFLNKAVSVGNSFKTADSW